jgi:hypothetical protein
VESDLLTTFCQLSGVKVLDDRVIDSSNLLAVGPSSEARPLSGPITLVPLRTTFFLHHALTS